MHEVVSIRPCVNIINVKITLSAERIDLRYHNPANEGDHISMLQPFLGGWIGLDAFGTSSD